MEKEINIAEILKNVPISTKLYSPLFGDVFLKYIGEIFITVRHHSTTANFYHNGRLYDYEGTEPMLFPSREMRDWSKVTWKKGDVLQNNDHNIQVIFDRFTSDTYEMIRCKYWLKVDNGNEKFVIETNEFTKNFFKVSEELSQCYINEIENRLGGKLNIETLEIEKQPEFKDGDIVFMKGIKSKLFANCIFILKGEYKDGDERAFYYAFYNADDKFTEAEYGNTKVHYSLRLATDSEKQQLFEALSKEGKAWNAKKKMIVNLKPKVELKPFDKVLVRNYDCNAWQISLFGYKNSLNCYYCCNGSSWIQCIPYEGNEHLLGTKF